MRFRLNVCQAYAILMLMLVVCTVNPAIAQDPFDDPFGRFGDDVPRGVDLGKLFRVITGKEAELQKRRDQFIAQEAMIDDLARRWREEEVELRKRPIQCELPEIDPRKEDYVYREHLLFWDATPESRRDYPYLSYVWEQQIQLLKQRLLDFGVPEGQIKIVPLSKTSQIDAQIKAQGAVHEKSVYFFGHADRMTAFVGSQAFSFQMRLQEYSEHGVRMLGHYGCEFTRDCYPENLEPPQKVAQAASGQIKETLTVFGHRKVSRADRDDSPNDLVNPLEVIRIQCDAKPSTLRWPFSDDYMSSYLLGEIPSFYSRIADPNFPSPMISLREEMLRSESLLGSFYGRDPFGLRSGKPPADPVVSATGK